MARDRRFLAGARVSVNIVLLAAPKENAPGGRQLFY